MHIPLLLTRASSAAGGIDVLFWAVTINAIVFTLLIAVAIVFFAVRYRRGHKVNRANAPLHNVPIEVAWTAIPLAIAMAIFAASAVMFFHLRRVPPGSMEIYVTGKQWMWKIQHPEGRWENNELHVPVNRAIRLTMTSEDVIHSFYVPAFRLKMDVIPGEYTQLWFRPTKTGRFHLFCAEFCGTLHSKMIGSIVVMEPAEYERWLRAGTVSESLAAAGQRIFIDKGCDGCHGGSGSVRAPSLAGIYGRPIPVQIPPEGVTGRALFGALERIPAQTVVVDDTYIYDSIVLPEKHIAAGYLPIMPTFKNRLTEAEILRLVAYIKSLGEVTGANQGRTREETARPLSAEEYQARVGFVPTNVPTNSGGAASPATPRQPQQSPTPAPGSPTAPRR